MFLVKFYYELNYWNNNETGVFIVGEGGVDGCINEITVSWVLYFIFSAVFSDIISNVRYYLRPILI